MGLKMANEKRLIDANAVMKEVERCFAPPRTLLTVYEVLSGIIKNAPTVDAVEVVRCKDCKHCTICYPEKQLDKEATQAWLCKKYKRWTKPDDFCSYGERRTDNEKS